MIDPRVAPAAAGALCNGEGQQDKCKCRAKNNQAENVNVDRSAKGWGNVGVGGRRNPKARQPMSEFLRGSILALSSRFWTHLVIVLFL